jgi:predicted DNA-binding transcriptional regulator AlpA
MKTHPFTTLLTEKQMAALLAISWRGLQELRKRRLVPHIRLGRSIRYCPSAVQTAIEKLTVESV